MNRASRGILFASAAGAAWLLLACVPELAGGSSSTETGDKVSLSGRVLSGGAPAPGVAVSLARAGLSDTTDASGTYSLVGTSVSPIPAAPDSPDTLRFAVNGSVVLRQSVPGWIGALPDVEIVQRGFSGVLLESMAPVGRIEGVVTGDGISEGDSVAATFFHNALAGNYSGFIYFPPPGNAVRNYVVHVNAYHPDGPLTGRSRTVPFTSLAGNITIPAFDPGNLAADTIH